MPACMALDGCASGACKQVHEVDDHGTELWTDTEVGSTQASEPGGHRVSMSGEDQGEPKDHQSNCPSRGNARVSLVPGAQGFKAALVVLKGAVRIGAICTHVHQRYGELFSPLSRAGRSPVVMRAWLRHDS